VLQKYIYIRNTLASGPLGIKPLISDARRRQAGSIKLRVRKAQTVEGGLLSKVEWDHARLPISCSPVGHMKFAVLVSAGTKLDLTVGWCNGGLTSPLPKRYLVSSDSVIRIGRNRSSELTI